MIYLSSFFKNSFLFHFDDPKLNVRALDLRKNDDDDGRVNVFMCLDSLVRVRDDLIINMSIKIKCKSDKIDSLSYLLDHPVDQLFLNSLRSSNGSIIYD